MEKTNVSINLLLIFVAAIIITVAVYFLNVLAFSSFSPNEILKRDRWKPEGFIRFSLVLMLAGVLMLLVYFLY